MWRNNLRPTSPSARTTGTGKGTGYIDTGTVVATTGTINSSRPEHTKRTQGNAEQHKATHAGQAEPTQPRQHQQVTKNRTPRIPNTTFVLETTNDRKPENLRTNQPQAAPIETTTQGLPQPHRPSQPNLPRTTLDPTRHPRQHRTRTSNVQAPHGITPCGVCARYSAAK